MLLDERADGRIALGDPRAVQQITRRAEWGEVDLDALTPETGQTFNGAREGRAGDGRV